MHAPELFVDLLIIFLVSVPVAFVCMRMRLPLLVGFMLTGIAIGPYALELINDVAAIEVLAEIGVMLLLFTIGLEFSIRQLAEMRRLVLIGGGLQVVVTITLTAVIFSVLGRSVNQSIFFGFLIALSSTAIVLKSYVDRKEVDAPHGRAGVGILLFQDICVVLMLLIIPVLGSGHDVVSFASIAIRLGTALLAIGLIVAGAWFLLPLFLKKVVRLKSPELFLLTVVLFCLGMSWVTSQLGMSLALGAFIAGMVLADSDFKHQASADILPFRDIFNSIFFVSIGLLLSLSALVANFGFVLVLVVGLVVGKAMLIWAIIRVLGSPTRVAAMTGLGLAQIGEFSFVVARAGQPYGLLPESDYQTFLAASIISMLATPFLIGWSPRIGFAAQKFFKDRNPNDGEEAPVSAEIHLTASRGLQDHVIIVGYGLNGRNLSRVLRSVGIPYVVLDLDAELVRSAKAEGEHISFGDATRREVLVHAGVERASVLVLAMSDPQAVRRTVHQSRRLNNDLHIVVRTRYVSEITGLLALGADEIIPEEFETSIEIFSRVLQRYGVARNVIESEIDRIREEGYKMLRSPSIPASPRPGTLGKTLDPASTEKVQLTQGSPVADKSLGELDLRGRSGATVIAVIRDGATKVSPGANYKLKEGDMVILLGTPEKITRAKQVLHCESPAGGFNP